MSAFEAGRSAAQSAHSDSHSASVNAPYDAQQAAREADAAERSANEAAQRLSEARDALERGTTPDANGNVEIGPEAAALLDEYISGYEAMAAASAARAAAARASIVQPVATSAGPVTVVVLASPPVVMTPPAAPPPAPTNLVFPNGTPDPYALQQGDFGTCPFLAALVSMAQQRPADLMSMVSDNGDGTYTVTFPGSRPVVVEGSAEGGACSGQDGAWASIFEQAYRQLAWTDGGPSGKGIEYLTGHSVDTDVLSLTRESVTRTKLQDALGEQRLVTACVSKLGVTALANKLGWSALPSGHIYTVMGYDPSRDVIILRNPWGLDGTIDGNVISLTLSQFDSLFSFISYEEIPETVEVGVLNRDRAAESDLPFVMSPHPVIEQAHSCGR